jgi:hypothetical protein
VDTLLLSLLLPWLVVFALFLVVGVAVGRWALPVPLILGAAAAIAWAIETPGDTAAWFTIVWLIVTTAIGEAGAVVGVDLRPSFARRFARPS